MQIIKVDHLTKDYGHHRGVFDISFEIKEGEVFGFLGPNGAGKTTAIRQMLGFIYPDSGNIVIGGKEVKKSYYEINADIGYLPGEINFPEGMTGIEFIKWCAELRGLPDLTRSYELIDRFHLKNADKAMNRMSKGMKQKVGIVCAFMHNPSVYILDEPTSGLDPLMQQTFIDLIREEKHKGKTVLMSSHMFPEIEKTCDRTAIIKNGEIVATVSLADILKANHKTYKIKFLVAGESEKFVAAETFEYAEVNHEKNRLKIHIDDSDINRLLLSMTKYKVAYLSEIKMTLEDYFMHFYEMENGGEEQ
jgi:ABC-2 type transport system ATP-binding protein